MSATAQSELEVNLDAYAHNLLAVRERISTKSSLMPIVKANAYGLGAVPISKRAVQEGAAMLGVATVEEGIELRDAGIDAPILVLLQPPVQALQAIAEYDLRVMVSDFEYVEKLGDVARRMKKLVAIHCKIDTGMGRQGFPVETADQQIQLVTRISNVDIEGIATHFPSAEEASNPFTINQIRVFRQLLKKMERSGIPYEMTHAANSAAVVNYPESAFEMVRVGLMTYGVWPTETPPEDDPLKPVARWTTKVVALRDILGGTTISYGRTYRAQNALRTAVLPVGYADGYLHSLSNRSDVLIRGVRCPVRGRICMDCMVVDVSKVESIATGDTATLIGKDGNDTITVKELAQKAESIPYEILTRIGARVARRYTAEA